MIVNNRFIFTTFANNEFCVFLSSSRYNDLKPNFFESFFDLSCWKCRRRRIL